MSERRIIVVGGGAAGFLAAITCAESAPASSVTVLEKSGRVLDKVRISGGGRCNVTHACFDPRTFATRYPRGGAALLTPFQQFSARDTVRWFEARGVRLKAEEDGRMFPVTDSSQTVVDCLLGSARTAGVALKLNCGVTSVARQPAGGFGLLLADGEELRCDRLLLATGGCRAPAAGQLAVALGHTLATPVPSLFTFQIEVPWLRALAGLSVSIAEVSIPTARLRERGPLLITHWGLSGPVVLRLSAWGARTLHAAAYRFPLRVDWLPEWNVEALATEFGRRRQVQGARQVVNVPIAPLPARLWEQLVLAAGIARETRWSSLTRAQIHRLTQQLQNTEFSVTGKSLHKEEFVTCGGVNLREVDFKTMESRVCAGLFLAGELLDIDGITGGFNFQAAWTTGFIAGCSMANPENSG